MRIQSQRIQSQKTLLVDRKRDPAAVWNRPASTAGAWGRRRRPALGQVADDRGGLRQAQHHHADSLKSLLYYHLIGATEKDELFSKNRR